MDLQEPIVMEWAFRQSLDDPGIHDAFPLIIFFQEWGLLELEDLSLKFADQ